MKQKIFENSFMNVHFFEQERSTKGKLSKTQMVSVYKDLSNLDSTRIDKVVDSLANIFDEDNSGYVGMYFILNFYFVKKCLLLDVNEFLRGFILTTKGDLASKIEYTFRLYDENNDNEISGDEIKKMANVIQNLKQSQMKYVNFVLYILFRL